MTLAAIWLAGAAQADWVRLDDAGIVAALTGTEVVYEDGATQRFYASGRTRYTSVEPSWGSWRAEDGQYCSQWPPAMTWDCYDLLRDEAGALGWDDAYGNRTIGRPVE